MCVDNGLGNFEQLSRVFLDRLPCVAMLLKKESREIVFSNRMAAEVGAVYGTRCFESWAKRETPCPWCLAPDVWKTGKEKHLEVEHKGIFYDAYWLPVSDDVYMHYAFDVTERKKAEEQMRQKIVEIERMNFLMIGREKRVIELKKEVDEALRKAGLPHKYGS